MKPFYEDDSGSIYCGNCLDILPLLPKGDLLLTDPPYFISSEVIIHRSMNPKKYKYQGKDLTSGFDQWDKFESEEAYLLFCQDWIEKASLVVKDTGHLISFFDQNRVSQLIEYGRQHHLIFRQHLYWRKTNPVPRARKVDFMSAVESACWFTKKIKTKATFHYEYGQQATIIDAPIPGHTTKDDGRRIHPTQKPYKVMATWIRYLTNYGDLVIDPFMGSGITLYTAKKLGRRYIGIDSREEYCWKAADHCRQIFMGMDV